VQRGDQLLYPWRVFGGELQADGPSLVVLSRDVRGRYKMSAATQSTLAGLVLGRRDVYVELSQKLPTEADVASASRSMYERWLRQLPELEATARTDPNGLLVLMRPKEAIQGAAETAERQKR